MLPPCNPWHPEHARAEALRESFAEEHEATAIRFSSYNISRLLRSTGERPDRVDEAWEFLIALGMDGAGGKQSPTQLGVFDHGVVWARWGRPWAITGHPYQITDLHRFTLTTLGRTFPTLKVAIDDRPSFYGFGSHHVRIEVPKPRRPYTVPLATRQTQEIKRQFKGALQGR